MNKKKPNILILVGAPGSGKSTFAKYFMRTEENWARVSRDDFRAMQFEGTRASEDTEVMITTAIEACIKAYLARNISVLIDATHCRKDYINEYIKKYNSLANISFKVFDVSYEELLQRCATREAATGKHIPLKVIEQFVSQLKHLKTVFDFAPLACQELKFEPMAEDTTKPSVFLCDLDGTIAHANGRSMYDPIDADIMNDTPIVPAIKVLQSLSVHYKVIFVSGRKEDSYSATKKWLEQHVFEKIDGDMLLMRKSNDSRRDSIVKTEILKEQILPKYNVVGVFDDRLQVIRECWNAQGIFCFNVNQYLEEF